MPRRKNPYHVDWIFATGSNVHVADDREWFITYTPFRSYLGGAASGPEVLGIGDVALEVKVRESPKMGSQMHKTLVLHDVLHAPASTVNIVGAPILQEYGMHLSRERSIFTVQGTDEVAALLDRPGGLFKVLLAGQQKGQTSLDRDSIYHINATWSDAERARWEAYRRGHRQDSRIPEYTAEEKAWLKQKWGGEYKMLIAHSLSIYKEEDRKEGRSITRAMMLDETGDESSGEES
jgi:hypothetical protein